GKGGQVRHTAGQRDHLGAAGDGEESSYLGGGHACRAGGVATQMWIQTAAACRFEGHTRSSRRFSDSVECNWRDNHHLPVPARRQTGLSWVTHTWVGARSEPRVEVRCRDASWASRWTT